MRRAEREISDPIEIETIIMRSAVCRLAMSDDNCPYIVPMNFGYKDNVLYFHSATEGKKVDILKSNSNVCFEFDIDHELIESPNACDYSMKYRSVIGFGTATKIECPSEKKEALSIIMRQYTDSEPNFEFAESSFNRTVLFKVLIKSITGKKSNFGLYANPSERVIE